MVVAPRAYRFDGYKVDLARRQLTGSEGECLPLSSRAYEVLIHLIEHRARIVRKDELLAAVWPDVVVEENNLSQAISTLRRTLADSRESARIIATVPGRGYQFVADVQVETLSEPMSAAGTESKAWPTRSSTSDVTPRSIAVLPFRPLLDSTADEALELGIADALISRLSGLEGLIVAPLSSVRVYRGELQDSLSVGRRLSVAAVLEGNIQLQSNRAQLTARLLDVESGAAIWSGRFDEGTDNFFAMQDVLAQQVVAALEGELSAATSRHLRPQDTDNLDAWQLFLQGRFNWGVRSQEGLRKAVKFFEAALLLDPEFARAAAGLADSWALLGVFNIEPPKQAFARARTYAQRAIAIDPQLAEAHAALGHVLVQFEHDWSGGERQYQMALKLNPSDAQSVMWMANNYCYQGRLSDALAQAQKAQNLEPMSVIYAANVGMIQYYMRDYSTARGRLEKLVQSVPTAPIARRYLARVLMMQGSAAKALELLEGHETENAPGSLSDMGRALALDGQPEKARAELKRLKALGEKGFGVGHDIALISAALGEYSEALTALEVGAIDGSQMIGFLNSDPGLDLIREDLRFRALSDRMGLSASR